MKFKHLGLAVFAFLLGSLATFVVGNMAAQNKPSVIAPAVLTKAGEVPAFAGVLIQGKDKSDLQVLVTDQNDKIVDMFRFNRNGNAMFTIKADGTIVAFNGFKPSAAAEVFWRTMAQSYPPVCERIAKETYKK